MLSNPSACRGFRDFGNYGSEVCESGGQNQTIWNIGAGPWLNPDTFCRPMVSL